MSGAPPPPDERWEDLNALVDGELAPDRLAAVAGRIADDPVQARAFAALAALKAGTAGARPVRRPGDASGRSARRRAGAAALLTGAVLFGSLLGGSVMWLVDAPRIAPAQERAVSASPAASPHLDARLPALDAHGLRLDRVDVASGSAPRAEALYVGERGCRLRLRVRPADAEGEASPSGEEARWRVGDVLYLMVSERMDRDRFEAVVAAARAETRGEPPAPADAVAARADRPCLG